MKTTARHIIFVITFLTLVASAHAQSPQEELQQLVEQLQKTPGDNALREKIIKLSANVKPALAIPEEARRAFVRGNVAMTDAKGTEDYSRAAQLYVEASTLAPWWADPYYNLAKAREQRQEYSAAIKALQLYLLADIPAAERREAQDRIYVLEERASVRQRGKDRPQALAQQLQSKYGNRRWTAHLSCWNTAGGQRLNCNDSEAQGTTWTQGAPDGSYSWMPILTRAGSLDFTSLNIRHMFRVDSSKQNQIIMGYANDDYIYCGSVNGPEIKDIEWKYCLPGQPVERVELSFGTGLNGRPMVERAWFCDAARRCARDRWILE